MKIKSLIFTISILMISFVSCENKERPVKTAISIPIVPIEQTVKDEPRIKEFANPVLILGSSFGNYFQMMYKQGKFDDMLKFTSSGSIAKYGKKNIRKMYETMEFAYTMKLKSKTGTDTTVLNYEAGIYATKHMIRIPVVVENDTVKIVIHNLKGLK